MFFREIKKPYLIAEVGINHNGDLQIAKRLIDATFACGWDCVKFQKRNPDVCVPEQQKNMLKETPWGKMSYLEYKQRMEFNWKDYVEIRNYCNSKPLDWAVSVWDLDSLRLMTNYPIKFLKIPSALLTNLELITEASKSKLPLILSTGMSTIEEVDKAVEIVTKYTDNFLLMHCNSSYPAKTEELNLLCIKTLKDRYKCEVGYSGHEYGLEPTTYAVVLGVKVIERHITIDHNMWGTDQSTSIEPMGMDMLYKRIRHIEDILGNGIKTVYPSELEVKKKLRG